MKVSLAGIAAGPRTAQGSGAAPGSARRVRAGGRGAAGRRGSAGLGSVPSPARDPRGAALGAGGGREPRPCGGGGGGEAGGQRSGGAAAGREALRVQGGRVLVSVRPSVCPSACLSVQRCRAAAGSEQCRGEPGEGWPRRGRLPGGDPPRTGPAGSLGGLGAAWERGGDPGFYSPSAGWGETSGVEARVGEAPPGAAPRPAAASLSPSLSPSLPLGPSPTCGRPPPPFPWPPVGAAAGAPADAASSPPRRPRGDVAVSLLD